MSRGGESLGELMIERAESRHRRGCGTGIKRLARTKSGLSKHTSMTGY